MSNYWLRMAENNQITPGRQQMLLYLAHKNDWVYVTEVFRGADPEGITSLHGARKALRELDYVEMENVTPGRPTYQCRLKKDTDTFAKLLNTFIGTEYAEDFLKSAYVGRFSAQDPKTESAVMEAITDKLKTVQLVCKAFYPASPLANELETILASGTLYGDTKKVMPRRGQVTCGPMGSTFSALGAAMSQIVIPSISEIMGGAIRLDEINEKKQLPPPKPVQ